jgi:hypothetical protein
LLESLVARVRHAAHATTRASLAASTSSLPPAVEPVCDSRLRHWRECKARCGPADGSAVWREGVSDDKQITSLFVTLSLKLSALLL